MKKLIFSLAVLGLVGGRMAVYGSLQDGWQMVEAPISSGVVAGPTGAIGNVAVTGSTSPCRLQAIYTSSDSSSVGGNWFVVLNTVPINSIPAFTTFPPDRYVSPSIPFPISTITANTVNAAIYKVADFGEEGVYISSSPYVYKSIATSGQANRVYLKIRR